MDQTLPSPVGIPAVRAVPLLTGSTLGFLLCHAVASHAATSCGRTLRFSRCAASSAQASDLALWNNPSAVDLGRAGNIR